MSYLYTIKFLISSFTIFQIVFVILLISFIINNRKGHINEMPFAISCYLFF
ncbi:hypothetical protein XNC1_1471 [Xenorhabdus nematophila ATCC 19061]|uniref:Uncharacterized protein n=1 Tax=Xenorhabdus nematophila (strain ATCC 19061 / DSM 3370 / CCUG 14189 / LMG 1036 / NCIMB 9965 / AN6) TaxID=406817 RepID=D3VB95_XENNA|nr:hypothetical protein XNC1_1471 [Xenorhabdus nematophila ATCC 19061]